MVTKGILLRKQGIHARQAAEIVRKANQYQSDIRIIMGAVDVDAKSVIGMMRLQFRPSTKLRIEAEGIDEEEALEGLCVFIEALYKAH